MSLKMTLKMPLNMSLKMPLKMSLNMALKMSLNLRVLVRYCQPDHLTSANIFRKNRVSHADRSIEALAQF